MTAFRKSPGATSGPFDASAAATAVLDRQAALIGWSQQAEALFGYRADEVLGQPADQVLMDASNGTHARFALKPGNQEQLHSRSIRGRDGGVVRVCLRVRPLHHPESGAAWVIDAVPAEQFDQWARDRAMLAVLITESPIALAIYNREAQISWANSSYAGQIGLQPQDVVGWRVRELLPTGSVVSPQHPRELEQVIEHVWQTGETVFDVLYRGPSPLDPHHDQTWSCSYFLLQSGDGSLLGVGEASFLVTDRYLAQQRLALLSRASGSIGQTLDIQRTAAELAEASVPEFANMAMVDLLEPVLRGEEPGSGAAEQPYPPLRRVAEQASLDRSEWAQATAERLERSRPPEGATLGDTQPYGSEGLVDGNSTLELIPATTSSADTGFWRLVVQLRTRSTVLGLVTFIRPPYAPFAAEDVELAHELATRTAACLDNARRFVQERATTLMLQRNLLPRSIYEPTAAEIAHRYIPAAGPSGVGGDWYDVIPLSGSRVGLVVGDVVGHGLNAAAAMGRLRTTVAALAALDLPPDELLARLDDLVAQRCKLGNARNHTREVSDPTVGATCLYALYDPVTLHCVMASAGHPPPLMITPDRKAAFLELSPGLPLGVGDLPFESTEVVLPPGSMLALFTDGLVETRERDLTTGLERMRAVLAHANDPEAACDAATALLPEPPADDAALLVARVHALADDCVATWEIPAETAEVAQARKLASEQLALWKLEDAAFVVELVVSELVTNAIRYASGPLTLRLIYDGNIICEVADTAHTSPHLRRAGSEDEGGRGLFLVAQLTERWGTRYTAAGKTIWTEVPATQG